LICIANCILGIICYILLQLRHITHMLIDANFIVYDEFEKQLYLINLSLTMIPIPLKNYIPYLKNKFLYYHLHCALN